MKKDEQAIVLVGELVVRHMESGVAIDLSGYDDVELERVLRGLGFTDETEPWLKTQTERRADGRHAGDGST